MDAYYPVEVATYLAQAEQLRRGEGAFTIRNLVNTFAVVTDRGKKRPLREITAEEQRRVNELLAEWAARHFRPMMIVEDAGFAEFVRFTTEELGSVKVILSKRGKLRLEIIKLAQEYRRRVKVEIPPCVVHSLHLFVAGAIIKKKKTERESEPAWVDTAAAEGDADIVEHEDEAVLYPQDRSEIEALREIAIEDLDGFLDEAIAAPQQNEMTSVHTIVQHIRTLAVYFRKSPRGKHRLGAIQVKQLNVKVNDVVCPIVDCPIRRNSCWKMLKRLIELESALVKFFAF
ncbi:hypothetical protein PInf_011714 [Phytophthora infestans]|nr:hypothetical protein PInf_011714 [Phytophthora infestans]